MTSFALSSFNLAASARWAGRILGLLLVALVVMFFFGTGGFNPFHLRPIEAVQMTFFVMACIGMLIGWRSELVGGIVSTIGILLFFLVQFAATGTLPRGFVFPLMVLPGAFLLVSACVGSKARCRLG